CPVGFQQTDSRSKNAKKPEASQKRIRKEFQKEDALRRKDRVISVTENVAVDEHRK
ncbi:hypothetical protein Tco_0285040, partial [Tanacetum coccineum]